MLLIGFFFIISSKDIATTFDKSLLSYFAF